MPEGRSMTANLPWKEVVDMETYSTRNHPPGTYTKVLKLSCGHEVFRKGSVPTPKKARCPLCERVPHVDRG